MRILARGPVTRTCSPGDIVQVTGVYMPTPAHGFEQQRRGLFHETHVEAYKIIKDKQNFKEYMLSDDQMGKVREIIDQCESETAVF